MADRRVLVVASVVAALLGFLAGILVGSGDEADRRSGSAGVSVVPHEPDQEHRQPTETSKFDLPVQSKAADHSGERPKASTSEPEPGRNASQLLDSLLAGVEIAGIPAGEGVIEGVVLNADSTPMSGVEVTCEPRAPLGAATPASSFSRGSGEIPDPKGELLRAITGRLSQASWVSNTRRIFRTGQDGRFVFEGLGDVEYVVRCYKRGFTFRAKAGQNPAGAIPGDRLEFTAIAVTAVSIELTGAAGSDIGHWQLRATELDADGSFSFNGSGRGERIWLRPGRYALDLSMDIAVIDKEKTGLWAHSVAIEVGAGIEQVSTFELMQRPSVWGRLILEDPRPESYGWLQVEVSRMNYESGTSSGGDRSGFLSAADNYSYSWVLKEAGWYRLQVKNTTGVLAERVFEIGAERKQVDLTVPSIDTEGWLNVTVLDHTGVGVEGCQLRTRYRSIQGGLELSAYGHSLGDGRYVVPYPNLTPVQKQVGGSWNVEVSYGHLKAVNEFEFDPVSQQELIVWCRASGTVEVEVEGYRGSGLEGQLSVIAKSNDDSVVLWHRPATNATADGVFHLGQYLTGNYTFVLRFGLNNRREIPLSVGTIEVVPGVNRLRLSIPPLNPVTVHVPGGEPGQRVSISGKLPSLWYIQATLGGDLKARIRHLPEGEASFQISPLGPSSRVIRGETHIVLE